MRAREQDAVPDFQEFDRRGVPGAADHQLGRHRLGGPAGGPVGRGTPVGKHQSHRGSASRLPRIQGQSVYLFSYKLSLYKIVEICRSISHLYFVQYCLFSISFSSVKITLRKEIGR